MTEDAPHALSPAARIERELDVAQAFRPSAPVDDAALFAGRIPQMASLVEVVGETGQHGIVYGERGVGKTSLAAVVALMLNQGGVAVRVNCASDDSFGGLWRKALSRMTITTRRLQAGFAGELVETARSLAADLPEHPTAIDVESALTQISAIARTVIFFDEFDQLGQRNVRKQMADTIKALSDSSVNVTIVLVGVANDVDGLIEDHASIERAVRQIQMPRMSQPELRQIVTRGVASVDMTIAPDALARITLLSQGLPHYTHLLAQAAARSAVRGGRDAIDVEHVGDAMQSAVSGAKQSLTARYHAATASPRKDTLYAAVLLAAALTQGDDLGFFAPAQAREPLRAILGRPVQIATFSSHLHAFAEPDRGSVLQKVGVERRYRFRFANPLLQPFVIMRALAEHEIEFDVLDRFLEVPDQQQLQLDEGG